MPQNDFIPFAFGPAANVVSQSEYAALGLVNGFQSGIALSQQCNKVWRQSSIMSSAVGQFIADNSGNSVIDDGTVPTIEQNLKLAIQNVSRIKATGATTFYVNTSSGNDTNNGLTSATPFKTINKAANTIYHNWDFNGFNVTISIANGTYAEQLNLNGNPLGCPSVRFQGNVSSPQSVVINGGVGNAVYLGGGFYGELDGVMVLASGTATQFISLGYGIVVTGSTLIVYSVNFGSCQSAQLTATSGGVIASHAGSTVLTFSGTNTYGMVAQSGGVLWVVASSISYAGGTTYSSANVSAFDSSTVYLQSATFGGSVPSGAKYFVSRNATINTFGGGASFIPGTTAGSASLNGVYT